MLKISTYNLQELIDGWIFEGVTSDGRREVTRGAVHWRSPLAPRTKGGLPRVLWLLLKGSVYRTLQWIPPSFGGTRGPAQRSTTSSELERRRQVDSFITFERIWCACKRNRGWEVFSRSKNREILVFGPFRDMEIIII